LKRKQRWGGKGQPMARTRNKNIRKNEKRAGTSMTAKESACDTTADRTQKT